MGFLFDNVLSICYLIVIKMNSIALKKLKKRPRMNRNFVFISGDVGGARMQLPAISVLRELGHNVDIVTDGKGMASNVFREAEMNFTKISNIKTLDTARYVGYNLIFLSTCASASDVAIAFSDKFYGSIPIVMGSDGLFNHGFKKWQEARGDYWFAITRGHKKAILEFRPDLSPKRVKVVGQPAFDSAMDLIPRKEEVRLNQRNQLSIGNEKVVLWWPTGIGELIEEDIEMVKSAIGQLGRMNAVFVMNGCHPKLENVRKGYIADIISRISDWCSNNGIRFINTQKSGIPLEELCLASDIILSITCTEDVKNTMMGGPLVVHLLGPLTRKWMEEELFLKPPHYLPDVVSGESLLACSLNEVADIIELALKPETEKRLREDWQPPKEKATEGVAKELITLAC